MKYLLITLALMSFNAQATYINLEGGDVVAKSQCRLNNKMFTCIVVSHKDLIFVVLLDKKGEYEIYLVQQEGSVLIWSRDSI